MAQSPFHLSPKGRLARSVSLAVCAGAGLVPVAAIAEEGVIEEVIVTSTRRAESLQDVPLAVSAFDGEFVKDVNLDDVKDLVAYTPGLTGNSKDSFIDALQIRGIFTLDFGVGGDPSISIFKNGLYQGRNGSVVTSLYDVERAEVLRGPQGFLFGRNSIAGGINVYTNKPTFDGVNGYVDVDLGERDHRVLEAAINMPVNENFAARLAVYHSEEDGYVDDVFDPSRDDLIAHEKQAARLSLRAQGEKTDANIMLEYETRDQSGTVYRALPGDTLQTLEALFGVSMRGDDQDLDSGLEDGNQDDADILSFGMQIDHDLDWATFSSITGFKSHDYAYAEDFDGSRFHVNTYSQDQKGNYFEQEFRLVSESDGPLSWYAGVSYYRENIDVLFSQTGDEDTMCAYYFAYVPYSNCSEYFASFGETFTPTPGGLRESNRVRGKYTGWAGYVDLTYAFSDAWDASVGLRYTKDTKRFKNNALPIESELGPFFALGFTTDGFVGDKESWDDLTPRFIVRFKPNNDWMFFASVTEGYKSGGFGSFALDPDPPFGTTDVTQADAVPDQFDPEKSISYEVGTKGTFAEGRARVAANAYFYDYEDLQVIVPGQGGGIQVGNAGQVDGWGFEGTLQWLLGENFDVFLSAAYADSEMNDIQVLCDGTDDCEGTGLAGLPEFSYGAVLAAHFPAGNGEVVGRLEAFGQTKTFGGQSELPVFKNDGWIETALRFGYRSNAGWDVIAYVENVLDEEYFDRTAEDSGIIPGFAFGPSRPRTFGVRFGYTFE